MESKMKYSNNMLELIGNTPLLKLNKAAKHVKANVFVKLEYLNPSGSYKDRMALSMIEAAEAGLTWNGKKLEQGGTVCDCSAGNTAPALAFVSAVKGYKTRLSAYTPLLRGDSTRLKIIKAYGADVRGSPPASDYLTEDQLKMVPEEDLKDLAWVIAAKREMADLEENLPNAVWVDQIYNQYNKIGQMSIGYELHEQLDGKIDAWGCAVGSGSTLLGVILALKEKGVNPLTFGIAPYGSESFMELKKPEAKRGEFELSKMSQQLVDWMGLKKWQTEKSIVEEMMDLGYPDEFFQVSEEEARNMANILCEEEGIYCGMSSGANVFIALKIAERLQPNQNVVTVIVDRRDRYLGEYPNDVFVV
jgi:cystathionine beta-synthase